MQSGKCFFFGGGGACFRFRAPNFWRFCSQGAKPQAYRRYIAPLFAPVRPFVSPSPLSYQSDKYKGRYLSYQSDKCKEKRTTTKGAKPLFFLLRLNSYLFLIRTKPY